MQLKPFYNIATKVSSRKSATTFGDLPDWLSRNQKQQNATAWKRRLVKMNLKF